MDKSPDAFRTISEVAEHLETPAHVLRFWESRFPQIRPVKRAGGRRYYRPSDVSLLTGIKRLLHDEGMTIRGVQKILREQGVRHVSGLAGTDDHADPGPGYDAEFAQTDFENAELVEPNDVDQRLPDPVPLRPGFSFAQPVAHSPEPDLIQASDTAAKTDDDIPETVVDDAMEEPVAEQALVLTQRAPDPEPAQMPLEQPGFTVPPAAPATMQLDLQMPDPDVAPVSAVATAEARHAEPVEFDDDDVDDAGGMPLASRIRSLPMGATATTIGSQFLAAVTRLQDLRDRMAQAATSGRS